MTSELVVGICGLGMRIAHVARAFAAHDKNFRIAGYCDPSDQPNGLKVLQEAKIDTGQNYGSLESLLEGEKLDLLMIGSPNSEHLAQIKTGLESGVRVLSEKPLVISEEETFELLEYLNRYGADSVLVGLVLRYSPLYQDFMRLKDEGVLGQVVSMEGSEHLGPAHGAFFMRDWRRHERMTGGYLLEKCCHDLDLYQGVMGCRPSRVASFGGRGSFRPENQEQEKYDVYQKWPGEWPRDASAFTGDADIVDFQTALIEYENGASLTFHTNMHAADKSRRICAIGTKGMIEGDFERNTLEAFDVKSEERVYNSSYIFDHEEGHYGSEELMVADIYNHLLHGAELPVNAIDALEAGLTAIKIDEARKSGSVVSMKDTWENFDRILGSRNTRFHKTAEA